MYVVIINGDKAYVTKSLYDAITTAKIHLGQDDRKVTIQYAILTEYTDG